MARLWMAPYLGFVLFISNPVLARTLEPGCLLENEFSTMTPNLDCVVANFQRNYFDCTHNPGPMIVIENRCDSEFLILLEPNEGSDDESSIEQLGHPVAVGESLVIETRLSGEAESWDSGAYSWSYPVQRDGLDYELEIGFSLTVPVPATASGGCQQAGALNSILWFFCLLGLLIHRFSSCDGRLISERD